MQQKKLITKYKFDFEIIAMGCSCKHFIIIIIMFLKV